MVKFLRERFATMAPYHSAYLTEGVILNSNESPYSVPEELMTYMKERVGDLLVNRYPDTDSLELANAVAKVYDVKIENVVCGVGSDELIDCILGSTLEDGDKVLMPYPSFSMYSQFTQLNSGQMIKVPLKSDFTYDVTAIKEVVCKEQPKVIFLCNPNNPTGCIFTRDEIRSILEVAKGLVVVDEAYAEFSEKEISMIPYVNDYDNLIVLKTFSKAYALAGARVGYGIACEAVINLINTVRPPYNVNIFSQAIGTWAIEHRDIFLENARRIVDNRKMLEQGLRNLGLKPYPSEANFVWLTLPEGVFEALEEKHIYIRKMKIDGSIYYRINAGTPEENNKLLEALKVLV